MTDSLYDDTDMDAGQMPGALSNPSLPNTSNSASSGSATQGARSLLKKVLRPSIWAAERNILPGSNMSIPTTGTAMSDRLACEQGGSNPDSIGERDAQMRDEVSEETPGAPNEDNQATKPPFNSLNTNTRAFNPDLPSSLLPMPDLPISIGGPCTFEGIGKDDDSHMEDDLAVNDNQQRDTSEDIHHNPWANAAVSRTTTAKRSNALQDLVRFHSERALRV